MSLYLQERSRWRLLQSDYCSNIQRKLWYISIDIVNVVTVFHTLDNILIEPKWKAAFFLDDRAIPQRSEALQNLCLEICRSDVQII